VREPTGPSTGPPAGPPTGPPSRPTGPPRGPGRVGGPPKRATGGGAVRGTAAAARRIYALIAAVVGLAGIAFVGWQLLTSAGILGGGASPRPSGAPNAVAGEIFLEPVDTVGPDPFTASVALPDPAPIAPSASPSPSIAGSATASPSTVDVTVVTGGTVGLYGGSTNDRVCDTAQMIAFLEESPVKAAAWAAVQGIEVSAIRSYLESLTPVRLRRDTRVTNHGFRQGVAEPRQSVLQAGTAVLVDDRGVPRARCFCGNPLAEPKPVPVQPTYTGQRWPSFDPRTVTAIAPAPAPLPAIPVVDPTTGDVVDRPIGSDGTAIGPSSSPSASSPPPSGSVVPATATPPVVVGPGEGQPVTRTPAFPSDITPLGAVGANSVDPNFPVGGAVDLDVASSWFSKGPHRADTVTDYSWSLSGPTAIGGVAIYGNAQNATPEFRQGFGFGQVTVEVVSGGTVVATHSVPLDGTPDPNVVLALPSGTTGDTVRLRFTGHESLDCGGVGEVLILGPDWQAERDAITNAGYGWLFDG
jgi:hypothetical protein